MGIGCYNGATYDNYGISLKKHGIACSEGSHTYRFVNCVAKDGSNMVYLFVDDRQIGPLTDHYVNSTLSDTENNWLSGKDFTMPYLGTATAPISNCVIHYLTVTERDYDPDIHVHLWSAWERISDPGPNGPGSEKRSCSACQEIETRDVEGVWQTHDLSKHLVSLPEAVCGKQNLWNILPHDSEYYHSGIQWAKHESGTVYSVTIAVSGGEQISATSFKKYGENGNTTGTGNGIRVTFFDAEGVLKTMSPQQTYAEFSANGGYIIAPEGTVAVNIPMYSNSNTNELYLLNREHTYGDWEITKEVTATAEGQEQQTCAACGDVRVRGIVPVQLTASVEPAKVTAGAKTGDVKIGLSAGLAIDGTAVADMELEYVITDESGKVFTLKEALAKPGKYTITPKVKTP